MVWVNHCLRTRLSLISKVVFVDYFRNCFAIDALSFIKAVAAHLSPEQAEFSRVAKDTQHVRCSVAFQLQPRLVPPAKTISATLPCPPRSLPIPLPTHSHHSRVAT